MRSFIVLKGLCQFFRNLKRVKCERVKKLVCVGNPRTRAQHTRARARVKNTRTQTCNTCTTHAQHTNTRTRTRARPRARAHTQTPKLTPQIHENYWAQTNTSPRVFYLSLDLNQAGGRALLDKRENGTGRREPDETRCPQKTRSHPSLRLNHVFCRTIFGHENKT